MKLITRALQAALFLGAIGTLSAASVCPSTPFTSSDCNFLITIAGGGSASVSTVAGSTPFNGPQTFVDGTMDPGMDGSLVGVVNNSSQALTGFTLMGTGANTGIFDFSFNGICVYTNSSYCGTSPTGYEGPTSSFSNLRSTSLFETTLGNVSFTPAVAAGSSTFFSIEDTAADINAHGGLKVSSLTFAASGPGSAAPEPADFALLASGLGMLFFFRRKLIA